MKRTLLLTAFSAALLCTTQANAQLGVSKISKKIVPKVTLGVKVGANVQQLDGNAALETKFKPGILGGIFVGVDKNKIGIRLEGLIKTARFDVNTTTSEVHINTVSLDIPALFEYKIIKRLYVQAGPQFSSLISAKSSSTGDVKNSFKNSDLSGVIGLEALLPLHLTVGGRYIKGFVNVNNTASTDKWKNTSMQFYVGYRFLN